MIKKLFLIVFLLYFNFNSFAQRLYLCQSDTIREFSVEVSDLDNDLQWDFISGSGAQIIQGQNTDKILVEFQSSGDFTLQFIEGYENGCSSSRELEITILPLPNVSFTMDNVCLNQNAKFLNTSVNVNEIISCVWTLPNYQFESENLDFTFFQTGVYPIKLEMIDEYGCINSVTTNVEISSPPTVDFYFYPEVLTTTNAEFNVTNLSQQGNYFWDFGDGNSSNDFEPSYEFENAGWQQVSLFVEDENGCQDSLMKEILVKVDLVLYLPNAFTPDRNGHNEIFGPKGKDLDKLTSFHLQILNKWGQVIFESFDIDNYWNGNTKNNEPAITDTYTWSLRVEDELGKKYHQFGQVDLIR